MAAQYQVYRNLTRKCLSVKHSGLVRSRGDCFVLEYATFNVSEAGRQRVLATGQKNVHATIRSSKVPARLEQIDTKLFCEIMEYGIPISYNPYSAELFFKRKDAELIPSNKVFRYVYVNSNGAILALDEQLELPL